MKKNIITVIIQFRKIFGKNNKIYIRANVQ